MHPFCHRESYAMAGPLLVIRAPVVCGSRMRDPYMRRRGQRHFRLMLTYGVGARHGEPAGRATPIST